MSDFSPSDFLTLLCGIALFLYGMQQGEKTLKRLGVSRLRQMIAGITKHRLAAYLTGFLTTLVTQSSSATTVMLVGLASAQLMTLRQSLGVILGSDLGTTVTVGLFAFKFYLIAPLLIAAGFLGSLAKRTSPLAHAGRLVLAAGFVFYGMGLMADASAGLRGVRFAAYILDKSFTNPWIGLAAGLLITALIHSSAATLAIVIALAQHWTFSNGDSPGLQHFLPIVLGANIGTCSTAFIALLQARAEGVRVAWAHLAFKLLGTCLALPFVWIAAGLHWSVPWSPALQIAGLHVAFNVYISTLFLPALPLFDRLIVRLTGQASGEAKRFRTLFLHDDVLPFPVLALSQAVKEISRMSEIVVRMVEESRELISHFQFRTTQRIAEEDDEVDFLHEQVMLFLTRIAREELGAEEASRSSELVMVTTDIEHIGDIVSKSITALAEKIDASPVSLSAEGRSELTEFLGTAAGLLKEALAAFTFSDTKLARSIYERKTAVKKQFSLLVDRHIDRLYQHKTDSLQTTSIHIDLLEEIQRINHFAFRIAAHVLKIYRAE